MTNNTEQQAVPVAQEAMVSVPLSTMNTIHTELACGMAFLGRGPGGTNADHIDRWAKLCSEVADGLAKADALVRPIVHPKKAPLACKSGEGAESSAPKPAAVGGLLDMTKADVEREGSYSSTMVRAGLLLDILNELYAHRARANAAIDATQTREAEWKPIANAPIERFVLVTLADGTEEDVVEAMQYRKDGWKMFGCNGGRAINPIAWMDKPTPFRAALNARGGA